MPVKSGSLKISLQTNIIHVDQYVFFATQCSEWHNTYGTKIHAWTVQWIILEMSSQCRAFIFR